jgi:acetylornithine/succinyldiaminopimelate/putrescine aminotransferase
MKKPKKPGDNISLKTKKNESPIIIEWINRQNNLMDSIRYLIENEVKVNGIRNLQNHIPAQRVISFDLASSSKNNEDVVKNSRNVEIAVTKDEFVQSDTSFEVESRTSQVSLPGKETEKALADDNIDEEDIESWI